MIQRQRLNIQLFVAIRRAICGVAVVADNFQHVFLVALVSRERAQLTRDLSGGGVRHACHDRCQSAGQCAAFV